MERVCFLLQVQPDLIDEYVENHQKVWPEMLAALEQAGWRNYSLFIRPDGLLVGYFECEDFAQAQASLAHSDVNTGWQAASARFFIGLEGKRADEGLQRLPEVFHVD